MNIPDYVWARISDELKKSAELVIETGNERDLALKVAGTDRTVTFFVCMESIAIEIQKLLEEKALTRVIIHPEAVIRKPN